MAPASTTCLAHAVDAAAPLRITSCGIRAPLSPHHQTRRQMPDFVAFLVVKGCIELTDELPDGIDRVTVGPGEIHVVAPGMWQASTRPFPPGMVFLWFHFSMGRQAPLDAAATDALVRELHSPASEPVAQRRWLIPRHLDLGDDLDAVTRSHTALFESARLWGLDDRGTQAIGAELVHRLHRTFTRSRLRGRDITRAEPAVAHVARAREHIRLHHQRAISLASVAEAIELNAEHLSRCFRRVTGRTVGEAILDARIDTAKRLLLEGYAVKEAAHHAGFASSGYFCRRFRRCVGTTPLGYLAGARGRVRLPTRR